MLNKHDLVMTGDPVTCLRPDGTSPILLMCDHASRALPEEYGDLGLPKERHDASKLSTGTPQCLLQGRAQAAPGLEQALGFVMDAIEDGQHLISVFAQRHRQPHVGLVDPAPATRDPGEASVS